MLEVIEAVDGVICLNICLIAGRSCRRKHTARPTRFGQMRSRPCCEVLSRPRSPSSPRSSQLPALLQQQLFERFIFRETGDAIAGFARSRSHLPFPAASVSIESIETGVLHALWG